MGEKKRSHAITEEYAKADPIYVAKTAVSISADLVERHAHETLGLTFQILALSSDPRRWKLWMAG